ncbi:VPA1269 family protein [Paraburkholderia unamae]|uniref:Integrase n=1 Tax=Paraburkholderia unamae TaxID=219649 RepID=A0ABX5KNK7_9BURK|nr:VPA1269 family protein [Paraburkholderia unamae]PVX83632.1 putative integrase [Paraburkholderia unamae]RAR63779.1 putative integrase [Paraburkholderia unamae]
MDKAELNASAVTRDLSVLDRAVGYWSKSEVLFNTSQKVVILDSSLNSSDLLKLSEDLGSEYIKQSLTALATRLLTEFGEDFVANDELSFELPDIEFKLKRSALARFGLNIGYQERGKAWIGIARLVSKIPDLDLPGRIDTLSDIFLKLHKSRDITVRFQYKSHNLSFFNSTEVNRFLEKLRPLEIENALEFLLQIARFTFDHKFPRNEVLSRNVAPLKLLDELGVTPLQTTHEIALYKVLHIAYAAEVLLAALALNRSILLSYDTIPCRAAAETLDKVFSLTDSPFTTSDRRLIRGVTFTSTIRSPFDFPENIVERTNYLLKRGVTSSMVLYRSSIEAIQLSRRDLPPWPLSLLDGRKSARALVRAEFEVPISSKPRNEPETRHKPRSPAELRASAGRLGGEWNRFTQIFENSSASGEQHFNAAMRTIVDWVEERGFRTPGDIEANDLLNSNAPLCAGSFFSHLKNRVASQKISESTAWSYWHEVARAFSIVAKALLVSPDAGLHLPADPFEGIKNPFSIDRGPKSPRPRLPRSVQEDMIEILLDPDEDGDPTFEWAKTACPNDTFIKRDSFNSEAEIVWCPTRARLLALLLIVPLRPKQVRWLDRGLMDECIWSFLTQSYVTNTHPLSAWRYADGSSHLQRYGRPSGVIQPLTDGLLGVVEPCIFVSTNKTQMWAPRDRKGYELPWPFLSEDEAGSLGVETARWIRLPYDLLRSQTEWINAHYPHPTPVFFNDSRSDEVAVNQKHSEFLPAFTPLFLDLSTEFFRNDKGRTKHYLPVSHAKITELFDALCAETEDRLAAKGETVELTRKTTGGRVSLYDIYSVRLAGISWLIEMGVPIHIVQELVVAHLTAVMTAHYNRPESRGVTELIIKNISENQTVYGWDRHRATLAHQEKKWTFNRQYARHRDADLLLQFWGWKIVPGGICPLGGTGCHVAIPNLDDSDARAKPRFSAIIGGCGNCRFFSTGPAFLIQQAQAMNEIMLELRGIGRTRNGVQDALHELSWRDTSDLDTNGRKKLALEAELLKEQISAIDKKSEVLILEWTNRYKMFVESEKLASGMVTDDASFADSEDEELTLLSLGESEEIRRQIEVRLESGGDFSLVKNILDSAIMLGGIERCSIGARESCVRFMDLVLRTEGSRYLLIDIPDDRTRHNAAYLMASFAERLVGIKGIQDSLDGSSPLCVEDENRNSFLSWVDEVLADAAGKRTVADLSGPDTPD